MYGVLIFFIDFLVREFRSQNELSPLGKDQTGASHLRAITMFFNLSKHI